MTSPLITKAEVNSVFQGRSLLAEKDFTPAEINYLVDFGLHLKALKQQNIPHHYLEGKNIALLLLALLLLELLLKHTLLKKIP